jgi:type IV pilus assembly protein PilE
MLPEGIAMQSVERIRMKSARSAGRPPRQTGVTFIELMAVVLIIAILGMIGIPSYRDYTIRAHRTEAKTALLRLATNQERFYIQNHRYSDTIDGSVGFALPKSENGVYAITVELLGADWTQGYKATATPVPGGGTNGVDQSVDAKCTSFSLTSAGDKTAQGTQPETCW